MRVRCGGGGAAAAAAAALLEQVLEARGDELLAGKVDHDARVVEALGAYLLAAHLGVLGVVEEDERLTLDPIDEHLVHVAVVAVGLEVVEQMRLLEARTHPVQPEYLARLALAEAHLDRVLADLLAVHATHRLDHAPYVAELNERIAQRR